jgi:tRNA dimethylallyltransferase
MVESPRKSIVLIAGPTASGKSALAMRLARERNGVVINADAMQVYRELRVITARPSAANEAQVPHRLYGYVSGAEDYSTGRWLSDVRTVLDRSWEEGRLPIVTGGTGLYFKVLEQGLAEVPPIPAEIKARWRDQQGDVSAMLLRRDPVMAARLNPSDRQRIVRALEVMEATGKSLAWWHERSGAAAVLKGATVERIYVDVPRPELHARAAQRFDMMLEQGALHEVKNLPPLDARKPVMKAIGVPELQAHLAGAITLDEARERAVAATRQYIKRQTTWWRGQMKDWRHE